MIVPRVRPVAAETLDTTRTGAAQGRIGISYDFVHSFRDPHGDIEAHRGEPAAGHNRHGLIICAGCVRVVAVELGLQLRAVLGQYPDRVLIGEIYLPVERLVTYYGESLSGAQLPFNFALIHAAWNAKTIASLIAEYEHVLPAGGETSECWWTDGGAKHVAAFRAPIVLVYRRNGEAGRAADVSLSSVCPVVW